MSSNPPCLASDLFFVLFNVLSSTYPFLAMTLITLDFLAMANRHGNYFEWLLEYWIFPSVLSSDPSLSSEWSICIFFVLFHHLFHPSIYPASCRMTFVEKLKNVAARAKARRWFYLTKYRQLLIDNLTIECLLLCSSDPSLSSQWSILCVIPSLIPSIHLQLLVEY